ncbi:hypothetical protein [Sphingomonas humi]|uniref:Uncharacterized protein n=1 Tax=Sphingomonas humi TaxID=335630 RepID=A0ABP7S4M9_9SPHN
MVGVALLLAFALSTPGPFTLVNRAGVTLENLSIRPSDGSSAWRALGSGTVAANGRADMPSPGGFLCAFDLRARLNGTQATWTSVNLCDVKTVTLNRRPDGTLWVDYD